MSIEDLKRILNSAGGAALSAKEDCRFAEARVVQAAKWVAESGIDEMGEFVQQLKDRVAELERFKRVESRSELFYWKANTALSEELRRQEIAEEALPKI